MRASESPFKSYMTKQILLFAYLMCSSVSRVMALKKIVCAIIAIYIFSEELQCSFEIVLRRYGVIEQKSFLTKKRDIKKKKKFADMLSFFFFIC